MSVAIAREALPDIGLNNASGITSLGRPILDVTPDSNVVTISKIPELLNAPTAKNIPSRVGNNFITISIPSFTPSTNISYIFFLSTNPYITTIIIINGIAIIEI